MDASSKKVARTSQEIADAAMDVSLEDLGLPSWDDKNLRLDVTQEDGGRAIKFPLLGWPSFARLFGEKSGAHATHGIFNLKPFRALGPQTA